MIRPEEEDEHRAVADARRRRATQTLLVGGLVTDDREVLKARQPLRGLLERLRRNVDQVDARRAAARLQRLREQHQLLAAAAPELDDGACVFADASRRSPARDARGDASRRA